VEEDSDRDETFYHHSSLGYCQRLDWLTINSKTLLKEVKKE